jgi:hypothetical protein
LGVGQRFLELGGQFVESHGKSFQLGRILGRRASISRCPALAGKRRG